MTTYNIVALLSHPTQQNVLDVWATNANATCRCYRDIIEFQKAVSEHEYTLAFVGWESQVPELSAEKLQKVKYMLSPDTYVVVLADNNQEQQIVTALLAGADRYLQTTTPHTISVALINAMIRRIDSGNNELEYHPYTMNRMTREVRVNDEKIQLTPGEFRIALHLFENHGRILTRTSLLRDIWGLPELQYNRRVDTKMSHVRRKMMLDGTFGWSLTFPRGKGYKLECMTPDTPRDNAPDSLPESE